MPTEGERWTQRVLAELRSDAYRPEAWLRFLDQSFARAQRTAAQRPGIRRQARTWGATMLFAGWATPHLLRRCGLPGPPPRLLMAWSLAEASMLMWHLGMAERPDGTHRQLDAADALSLARAWLAPVALTAPRRPAFALWLVGAGAASDLADGRLARRRGPTRLGQRLDSVADTSLFAALVAGGRWAGLVGTGTAGAVAMRYLSTVALGTWHYFVLAGPPPSETVAATRVVAPSMWTGLALTLAGRRRVGSMLLTASSLTALALGTAALTRATFARDEPGQADQQLAALDEASATEERHQQ